MAVIDWFSRYVLSWEVSITLDTSFCLEALDRALQVATPEIFSTRGCNLRVLNLPNGSRGRISVSVGMAADAPWTTSLWSAYGAA